MIRHEMGITRRETVEQRSHRVRLAIAIGVTEVDNAGLGHGNDAVFPHAETGDEFETGVENVLLVHFAIAVGIFQHADAVPSRSIVVAGIENASFLPCRGHERASSVRILRSFRHPHAALAVPLHGDGLVDQRFIGNEVRHEAGLHLELLDSIDSAQRTADGVAEVRKILLAAEFIGVLAFSCPGHGAQDEGTHARMGECFLSSLEKNRRAVTGGFVSP